MNNTAAVMLVNKAVRPMRVEYDPDTYKNNSPMRNFKTIDPSIAKDDLVIVQTNTRHGFTVAKVIEADFPVDFNDPSPWGWVCQKFDKATFDHVKATEDKIVRRVAEVQENKMRQELMDAAGLGDVSFSDLDLMTPKLPAPPVVDPSDTTTAPA